MLRAHLNTAEKNINMTPLTRQEKIRIYSEVLQFTEEAVAGVHGIIKGICIHLRAKLTYNQLMQSGVEWNQEAPYFPEWMAQRPEKVPGGNWWGWSTEDNIKRAEALRAAINLVKKGFCLEQLAQYVKDPTTCGINKETNGCMNITNDGKMCVAGKNLLPELIEEFRSDSISELFRIHYNNQYNIFIPESVGILDKNEWSKLQAIHDCIAKRGLNYELMAAVTKLQLFTIEELHALK